MTARRNLINDFEETTDEPYTPNNGTIGTIGDCKKNHISVTIKRIRNFNFVMIRRNLEKFFN